MAVLIGTGASEILFGGFSDDIISGFGGNDTIYASSGNDIAHGGAGNDTIVGGIGLDALTGGIGNDRFFFADDNLGADKITDFVLGLDDLVIDASAFGGGLAAASSLVAARFVAGATPAANQPFGQFLYDTDDGRLYWDVNGNTAAGGAVLIAALTGAPAISGTDFIIVP